MLVATSNKAFITCQSAFNCSVALFFVRLAAMGLAQHAKSHQQAACQRGSWHQWSCRHLLSDPVMD